MRFYRVIFALLIAGAVSGIAWAAMSPTIVMNGTEKWSFPVHYRPTQENVTVLSGTF